MPDWRGSGNPKFKDGRASHPLWAMYWTMRARCENPNFPSYKAYGARGISVCDRWKDFAAFAADVGERPEGTTLDRKESSGNYEPDNCRWATHETQSRNRPGYNVNIAFEGVTKTRAEWCRELGVPPSTVRKRVARGLSYEEAYART